ncbi:MAG: hypothetical protein JXA03_05250 [Bacteroidales bacterium]|nr:hypothetical protein [Bacteroidales bacterium]
MRNCLFCFLLIIAVSNTFNSFGQTATLGNVISAPGEQALVPLSFSGLDNVGAVSLYIVFDDDVAVFTDITNLAPEAEGTLANATVMMDSTVVGISWVAPGSSGVDFPDGKFFDLRFTYNNGTSPLNFFTLICEIVDWDLNVINMTYSNGSIAGNTGAAYSAWNGTGDWSDPQYWSNGIPGSSTYALIESGEVNVFSGAVCNKMKVEQGASLSIQPEFFLTIFDSLIVNGSFSILSSSIGTGSLIVSGEIINTGNLSVQRFIAGNGNRAHLISSPATGQTAAALGAAIISKYKEMTQEWTNLSASDELIAGTGYRVVAPADETYSFSGLIHNNDVTPAISFSTSGGTLFPAGANLIGNPFTSAISWNSAGWTKTHVDASVYVWNGVSYVSWNGEIGSLENGIIPSMQGFFVIAHGVSPQITIPEGARIHHNQPFYKEEKEPENMLKMILTNGMHEDQAYFQFKSPASGKFDNQYDAYKLKGLDDALQMYSFTSQDVPLSINVFPAPVSDSALPLGIMIPDPGEYKIIRSDFSIYGKPVYLKDIETGDTLNMKTDSVYSFTSEAGVFNERFLLYFSVPVSSVEETAFAGVQIYGFNGRIFINSPRSLHGATVEVYDLSGKRILHEEINTGNNPVISFNGQSGSLFIVRLFDGKFSVSQKIILPD